MLFRVPNCYEEFENKCNSNWRHMCFSFFFTLSLNFFLIICSFPYLLLFPSHIDLFSIFVLFSLCLSCLPDFSFLYTIFLAFFFTRLFSYILSSSFLYFFSAFLLSLLFPFVCTLCSFAGGQSDGLDCQCPAHGAHLYVRQYGGTWTHFMQHPVAREWTYQRSGRLYPLLLHPGIRHSSSAHLRVLLSRHTQTENCGAQEQIEREEEVAPESHQISAYSHSCVCPLLAALLDHSGA